MARAPSSLSRGSIAFGSGLRNPAPHPAPGQASSGAKWPGVAGPFHCRLKAESLCSGPRRGLSRKSGGATMRRLDRIVITLAALILAEPARAQGPAAVGAAAEAQPRAHDWMQEFPITPAFADWELVGDLVETGKPSARMWIHRDSLRWRKVVPTSTSGPFLWADVLLKFSASQVYSRRQLLLSCDSARIYITRVYGDVSLGADGAIKPISSLVDGFGYKFGY